MCPPEYPEDLIYDIWPGSRGYCDCLQREGDRNWNLDEECDKGKGHSEYDYGDETSDDCQDSTKPQVTVKRLVKTYKSSNCTLCSSIRQTKPRQILHIIKPDSAVDDNISLYIHRFDTRNIVGRSI